MQLALYTNISIFAPILKNNTYQMKNNTYQMKNIFSVAFFSIFISFTSIAQIKPNDVLFTVDNESVLATEFIRVYNKNLDLVKDESQKDIDNYLDLFVDYKLKLQEAKKLGLDQKPSYLRELKNYRKQLADNYLTDTNATESLIQEAYDRTAYEVNASHVLVRLAENAPAEDTLKTYNEISKLRERVLNEGFETVKKEVHNGQTIFAEDLGYFGGFKMVYDFESAAYNTPVGELSQPFRTRFGYHIVKVIDKRKSQGEVEVAHIMISKNQKSKDSTKQNLEKRINDIYTKLKQGESFESLAKEFSEDKSSASKGGKLSPFSGGQLSSKQFEDSAFALTEKGEISKPIETDFGWHILKLFSKKPVGSFEDMKNQLELKVKRDSRSKLINKAFVNKLKNQFKIEENIEALNYFGSIVDNNYFSRKWTIPTSLTKEKLLNQVGDKPITYGEFANYLLNSQRKNRTKKAINDIVKEQYTEFINQSVLGYYEDNLENYSQEFANVVNEYRDGLLLFDLMESEIWNAAKSDTLGLKKFYDKNKNQYYLSDRAEAVVASTSKEKTAKKVAKYFAEGWTEDQITKALNKKGKVNVIFSSGLMDKDHQALPSGFQFKNGISKVYNHNKSYIVANVKNILPKEQLSFDDAKGKVVSDFQDKIEKQWLQKLHDTYKVNVNEEILKKVKAQIKE